MAGRAAALLGRAVAPHRAFVRGLDRRVHLVAASSFLFIAGRMGLLTFLTVHLVRDVHLALPLVGLGFLVENVLRGAIAPFAGAWSDRVGRRPVLLASAVASAALMPASLLIYDATTLLLWSAAAGLAQGPYFPGATALLLDLAPEGRRQSVLAYHYGILGAGYAAGVLPAGFLAERGFHLLALESFAAFGLVALVVLVLLRGLPRGSGGGSRLLSATLRAPRDRPFAVLAVLGFLLPLGIGLTALGIPVYTSEFGVDQGLIGLALGLTGLAAAALSLPVNARIEATGPFRWLPVAALCCALSYVVLATGHGVLHATVALSLFALGEVLFSSALPTAVSLLAPPGARGAYQGAWAMVHTLGVGAALVLTGLGRDALGWSRTWLAFAALTLAAGLALALARGWFRGVADARARP